MRQIRRPDGSWKPYVEAAAVRPHLVELSKSGMGIRAIAAHAGTAPSTVTRILGSRAPKVRMVTAAALLSVTSAPASGSCVGTGRAARARDALLNAGWSVSAIACTSGLSSSAVRLRGRTCRARTEDRLCALAHLSGARFCDSEMVMPPMPPELFAAVQ